MRVGDGRFHVRIVRAIHRAEGPITRDAALEFFRRFLRRRFFQRIGATPEENRAPDAESDKDGFQALRIMGKVASDK